MLRVIAYCLRFKYNSSSQRENRLSGPLSPHELESAMKIIVKLVQRQSFMVELKDLSKNSPLQKKSSILSLTPFIDSEGLLRVGGRLRHSELPFCQKHPYILPREHHVSRLIVDYYHRKNLHLLTQALLYTLRQQFWPVGGRKMIQSVLRKCIVCIKQNPKFIQPIMGDFPANRITPQIVFNTTAVDYAGPFNLKASLTRSTAVIKVYIAVFICCVIKCVQPVIGLTTDTFLAALRRFISRRGKCSVIYCDDA